MKAVVDLPIIAPHGHLDATDGRATVYGRKLVLEMARMSTEDGLTMTLHPGVHRNHHRPTVDLIPGRSREVFGL